MNVNIRVDHTKKVIPGRSQGWPLHDVSQDKQDTMKIAPDDLCKKIEAPHNFCGEALVQDG